MAVVHSLEPELAVLDCRLVGPGCILGFDCILDCSLGPDYSLDCSLGFLDYRVSQPNQSLGTDSCRPCGDGEL